ncbi:serine/threonine protein kinase [Marivita hallyeonensis]|uniref:Serine/threonine protein kinase n=1 Tax=Marivita hallyeonensis TaxID=996342 RepID=A0A1M5PIN1_9RHOB|nr:serine/threonine protein kinase [Marivita hallyeonensis]SHH01561.1 serine/threonine protein kinase [Marivita hallyeonensis]
MADSRPGDLFQPGDLVNNTYRIEAILGRGGTSDVYKARSEISGRLMALKVLKSEFSSNDDYLLLLTREEAMREIRHDAVVRYADNNRTPDGHVYLLIDYVEGPGLDKKLKEGPIPAEDLLVICRRVAEGLQAAHAHNICHRDLSPDNIILRDGDPAQAVIIDFGIAKDTNPGAETIVGNEFAGKYAYAAPEQLAGNTDERTDIYSLGALLLANFRGQSPDIGKNPMEVVQKKAERLDTEGVPEPLKSLLDKMTDPDPDKRFQSASEVLAALGGVVPDDGGDGELSEATVIAPPPATAEKTNPKNTPSKTPKPARKAETPKSTQKLLVPIGAAAVVIAGLAAAFMSGVFTTQPQLPIADPYRLSIAKPKDATPRAVGFVPSETVANELREHMTRQEGTSDLTLAAGEIGETWGDDVIAVLETVDELDAWRVSLSGNRVEVEGTTTRKPLYDAVQAAFDAGVLGVLDGDVNVTLEELILAPQRLESILASLSDCGPLFLTNPPAAGYGPEATIEVRGTLSSEESRANLSNSLAAISGDRPVRIDTNILNPTLCLIESVMPKAPSSAIDIAFFQGDQDNAPNPSGVFVVGENPVIDVEIPGDTVDGYLSVSVLDVSGNVFHLLPNINRPDNSVQALRDGQTGAISVRVAYSIAEAQTNGGLAFRVDDSTLGKTKILAIHSSEPLFSEMRPTSESALSYSEALLEEDRNAASRIYSLDSRILETMAR